MLSSKILPCVGQSRTKTDVDQDSFGPQPVRPEAGKDQPRCGLILVQFVEILMFTDAVFAPSQVFLLLCSFNDDQ